MPLSGSADAVLYLLEPGRVNAMDVITYPRLANIGWSVDIARYKPVGFMGHTGSDAAALQPYSAYKYDRAVPFGTAMVRLSNGTSGALRKAPSSMTVEFMPFLDMRINDSDASLGDNGGFLVLCAVG